MIDGNHAVVQLICDLSERTTGISRLWHSLNAWRQGLSVLIQAGSSDIIHQRRMGGGTGETRGGRRRGREGEFLLWTEAILAQLAASSSPSEAVPCGERCISWTGGSRQSDPWWRHPVTPWGWLGKHWVLFHELRFCFSHRLDWSMSHWTALVLDRSRGFGSKVCRCLGWCRGIQCCLSPSNVWRWFEKVTLYLALTSFGGVEPCISVCVWKWIITEFTKMFSPFVPLPHLFYTWWIRFLNLEWELPAFLQLRLRLDNRVHLLNFFPPVCLPISSSSSSCFLPLPLSLWCYFVCKSSSGPFAELKKTRFCTDEWGAHVDSNPCWSARVCRLSFQCLFF